jgi:predicted nucleotidyltransferase
MSLSREQAVDRLLASAAEIRALGVERLALFGSVVRNEARPDSDVDLLVRFAPGAKTFEHFLALCELLESRLGRRVELVTTEALSPFLGPESWRRRWMSFEPRDYLRHILVEADYVIGESRQLTFEQFEEDGTLQRAFVRSLEIIGEARESFQEHFGEGSAP